MRVSWNPLRAPVESRPGGHRLTLTDLDWTETKRNEVTVIHQKESWQIEILEFSTASSGFAAEF